MSNKLDAQDIFIIKYSLEQQYKDTEKCIEIFSKSTIPLTDTENFLFKKAEVELEQIQSIFKKLQEDE